MSTSTLTRPTSVLRDDVRLPAPSVGSYVDTDGLRRAPQVAGSYTGTASVVGAYAGSPRAVGSYVRTER
jgi:hypothetical protein